VGWAYIEKQILVANTSVFYNSQFHYLTITDFTFYSHSLALPIMNGSNYKLFKLAGTKPDLALVLQVLTCTIIFAVYCIWYRTPLVADDHRFLIIASSENFNFLSLGECISRTPIYGVLFYWLLKLHYHTSTFYFFYILFFSIHSGAIYIIIKRIVAIFENSSNTPFINQKYLLVASILFSFHPNLYELFTMPGATIYVVGALFMALTINEKNHFKRLTFSLISFSIYETYILPIFILSLFPIFIGNINKKKIITIIINTSLLLIPLIIYLISRYTLSKIVGEYNQILSFDYYNNFQRIIRYSTIVFTNDYDNTLSSRIENIILVSLLIFSGYAKGYKTTIKILLALLLAFISSFIDLLVSYEGLRIIYGSLLIKYSIFGYLFYILWSKIKIYAILPILILSVIYSLNWYSVYKMRLYSYENQKNIENLVLAAYSENEPSNTLLLPPNPVHFHPNDWSLEPNSIIQPLVFKAIHKLNKELKIKFIGLDTLKFETSEFPILYPSRAFMPHDAKKVLRDPKSFTGQSFELKENEAGIGVFGPYIALDSGNYTVEIPIKLNKNSETASPGWVAVVADFGKTTIHLVEIEKGFFNGREFKSTILNFRVDSLTPNIEVQIISSGVVGMNIDYMRFTKK
jgi:hypothetical protein